MTVTRIIDIFSSQLSKTNYFVSLFTNSNVRVLSAYDPHYLSALSLKTLKMIAKT